MRQHPQSARAKAEWLQRQIRGVGVNGQMQKEQAHQATERIGARATPAVQQHGADSLQLMAVY